MWAFIPVTLQSSDLGIGTPSAAQDYKGYERLHQPLARYFDPPVTDTSEEEPVLNLD